MRVLIVDAEPELTELLAWAVADAGWQAFLAADGRRGALTMARGRVPHAVVLDGACRTWTVCTSCDGCGTRTRGCPCS